FGKDDWAYKMFRAWIADGMPRDKGSGAIKSVNVTPAEAAFTRAGEKTHLTVEAVFADGAKEDITALCDYRTNDETVAGVSNLGEIRATRPGDTAVIVSYRGQIMPVRVLVPMTPPEGFRYPDINPVNFIDSLVFEKLKRLNMAPANLSDDAEFLRRVTLDTIGSLPTPEEIRAFLADRDSKKREKKVDELLVHPRHAALWATKFCDITGNNTLRLENPQQFRPKLSQMWHDWFRKRVAENVPYDEIVKGVLTATSRDGKKPEDWVKRDARIREEASKGF